MCSIAGVWEMGAGEQLKGTAERMIAPVRHRGPDGSGVATGKHWALGHARLAIIDLEGGSQPLWDADRRTALVGNNEIYNAPELKRELEALGHRFTTQSDTEVILQGWLAWGTAVFGRLNGMFAVAVADGDRLVLARDSMGIKPLHVMEVGSQLLFGSEIKSLLALPQVSPRVDWDSAHLFLNFRYVPNEQTLFQGVRRIPPGTLLEVSPRGIRETVYAPFPKTSQSSLSYEDASAQLTETLQSSVKRHLLSDVEVGAYLSGGVDSSAVSALARGQVENLKTFCLGFDEPTDENEDARLVAKFLGTTHEDFTLEVGALDRLDEIIWHVEEPKVNCLQGFLLAEQVSRRVKVALSGLGGDELFAGYVNHDILAPMTRLLPLTRHLPLPGLQGLQRLGLGSGWDHTFRMGDLLNQAGDPLGFYCTLRNCFDHNRVWMNQIYDNPPSHWFGMSREALSPYYDPKSEDPFGALLALEAQTKLVNDFLLTEDRVSMAHGLEVRVPLLDREMIDLVFPLPSSYKYYRGEKKRLFRDVARNWLPPEVFSKKKWGFSVNPTLLFQKELREFARRELTRERVGDLGMFSWKWISDVLDAPVSPRRRWHYFNLWAICGFSLWHRQFIERQSVGQVARTGS